MVRIPMAAGIESLNVAAAAAICFFERVRQRERCVEPNGRRRAVIHLPGETPCERSED
jgi:tRNA C32,U32 (ribose-2'-O)-methylase TrmJ